MEIAVFRKLFRDYFHKELSVFKTLPPAGSQRKYFRLGVENEISVIGTFNNDIAENRAFLQFSAHFRSKALPVPEIFGISDDYKYYLQEDLGDICLKDLVDKHRSDTNFPDYLVSLYKQALHWLIKFQTEGNNGLDYSVSMPRDNFDSRSILWDLNHFKYFFLKLSNVPYNENLLEDDFITLAKDLDKIKRESFMYRDFQSRNIMIKDDKLYFIDYQGGRKGALQYDLASILFEARTNLPSEIREKLFRYYYNELLSLKIVNTDEIGFREVYMNFALIRQLQAMGAYGLRGWIEGKPLFIQSIGYAVKNLEWIVNECKGSIIKYPELNRVLVEITKNKKLTSINDTETGELLVRIYSFSYFRGIPDDISGNGGGYVFDCRHIHNPGKYAELSFLNGLDQEIDKFFIEETNMVTFLNNVYSMIDQTVKAYMKRGFKHLQVSFGCTGGKHRSVYAAQKLYEHLQSRGIKANIEHLELKDLYF